MFAVPQPAPTGGTGEVDAHVCGKCRAEFLELPDFLQHKKTCMQKPVVLMYDEDNKLEGPQNGAEGTQEEREEEMMEQPAESAAVADDTMLDENDNHEKGGDDSELLDNCERDSQMSDKSDISELNTSYGAEDEELDFEDKFLDKMPRLPGHLPHGAPAMFPLQHSNVKLESLDSTRVAVAQFAENNLAPSDVAYLQSTLYTLHQQQMMQMQLLQQLQQQLMAGLAPSLSNLPHLPGFPGGFPGLPGLPQTTPIIGSTAPGKVANSPPVSSSRTGEMAMANLKSDVALLRQDSNTKPPSSKAPDTPVGLSKSSSQAKPPITGPPASSALFTSPTSSSSNNNSLSSSSLFKKSESGKHQKFLIYFLVNINI